MAIQTINIGNQVNDGLGDDLRTAFQKVNANFSDLSAQLTITASNVGASGVGVFKQKTGANLEFKNLVSGTKMLLNDTGTAIIINNTAPDAFIRFDTDSGNVQASSYQQLTLGGASATGATTSRKDIEVSAFGSTISFRTRIPITDILTSFDFGYIGNVSPPSSYNAEAHYKYTTQLALQASNIDFGTINLPSTIGLDCGTIV